MRRVILIAAALFAGTFAILAIYETVRVVQARAQTPELMQDVLAHADPELATIPQRRIDMLIAVEDPTFRTNDGTDFTTPGQGWTTMTQGLAKRLYFHPFHPGFKKIELILIAKFALTPTATKAKILRAFLAEAYLGEGPKGPVTGFAQGARYWFGKPLRALSDDQYLALVAALPAPEVITPSSAANAKRVTRIKRLVAGKCRPNGPHDVMLDGCAGN